MKIGFIGAGKVGFSMGRYLMEHDVHVSGYYSRNFQSSKEAATFTNTKYYQSIEELVEESDTLFLTVPDSCIREVYSEMIQLDIRGKCLVHCSGALSSRIFSSISERGARGCSIHPICAVSDKLTGYQDLSKAYFTIEGEPVEDFAELFRSMGNPVEEISAEQKEKYHAAAVFASNLTVGLYHTATELLKDCGLSESFAANSLRPLFMGNATNIVNKGAVEALTGPVERADKGTIEKQLAVLTDPQREIYRLLSQQLLEVAAEKNPDRDYEPLKMLLEQSENR